MRVNYYEMGILPPFDGAGFEMASVRLLAMSSKFLVITPSKISLEVPSSLFLYLDPIADQLGYDI